MRALLLTLAACWTGSPPAPAPGPTPVPTTARARPRLEISLARTMCFGNCPAYHLEIHDNGNLEWTGEQYVAVTGTRTGVLADGDLDAIDQAIAKAKFFQRDGSGRLQEGPECTKSGNTTTCSWKSIVICSDTSHTVITIQRGNRRHTIDNAHCTDEEDPLNALENEITDRAKIMQWIGKD